MSLYDWEALITKSSLYCKSNDETQRSNDNTFLRRPPARLTRILRWPQQAPAPGVAARVEFESKAQKQ